MSDNEDRNFQLQRIYTKDISFESPGAPEVFTSSWKPSVNLQLNTNATRLSDNDYEVVLELTVTAENEEKVVYLVEIHQAGIFSVAGIEGAELEQLLGAYCPSLLYPYAREAVSDLVARGTFPQLLLQPINFDAIYQQSREQEEGGETTH